MPRASTSPGRARYAAVGIAALVSSALLTAPAVALATPSPPVAPFVTPGPVSTVGGVDLATPGVVADVPIGVAPPPVNEAASYVVADIDNGEVLAAKQAHLRLPPASTLKVLTALALLPELDKAQVVVGSEEAMRVEGSKVGIEGGLSYSVDLLFKALLMQSGNDAAQVLAETYGGVDATVERMNDLALELQAYDTVAVNPSGLDEPLQLTSAYDLALITRAALEREDFRTYLLTPRADLPGRDGATFQIQNENRLVASYEGAIGVKNGYTTLARHTFVGAATRGGRTYVAVVMRTESRPEPIVASLLDWAFTNADAVEPVGQLVGAAPTPVVTAAATPAVVAGPDDEPAQRAATASAGDGGGAAMTLALVALGLMFGVVALRVRAVRRRQVGRARPAAAHARNSEAVRDG